MRLQSILVENLLGIERAAVDLTRPVALFCGPNGAGKSTIADAVALALTADLRRVALKKDAPALIRDDAEAAVCEVRDADGDTYAVTIARSGRISDNQRGRDVDASLPYVLDAQRFARLDLTERRAFLFGLMGVKLSSADIRQRLLARLFPEAAPADDDLKRIDRMVPLLRGGFEAASKEAKAKATEAKGAWKTTTGEQWGSSKGATWRATAVASFSAASLDSAVKALAAADQSLSEAQQQLGALQADERRLAETRAKLEGQRGKAALLDRAKNKLQADQQSLADAQAQLLAAQVAAGAAPRVGLVHELAAGLKWALGFAPEGDERAVYASGALGLYEREHGPVDVSGGGDASARERLPQLISTRDLMQRSVDNDLRDVAAAEAAAAEVKVLEEQLAGTTATDGVDPAAVRQAVEKAQAARKAAGDQVERLRAAKAAAEAVERRTADAARQHADVMAWDAIGNALAPDGIPADLLREALQPMNERLAQAAADTDWPLVVIDGDMHITFGSRPLSLCSESEQWRAGAAIAEAIAHRSGVGLLCLDRFDVLDLPGRAQALGWLDVLAESGEIHTAIVCGTLKAKPQQLPPHIEAFWIDGARIDAPAMAEAA